MWAHALKFLPVSSILLLGADTKNDTKNLKPPGPHTVYVFLRK